MMVHGQPQRAVALVFFAAFVVVAAVDAVVDSISACRRRKGPQLRQTNLLATVFAQGSLSDYTLQTLKDPCSYQAQAYAWLEQHPNLHLLDEWRKVQLFALASFYYSWHGDDWQWSTKRFYMNYSLPECLWGDPFWHGFNGTCHEEGTYQRFKFSLGFRQPTGRNVSLPLELSLLKELQVLHLSNTGLSGVLSNWLSLPLIESFAHQDSTTTTSRPLLDLSLAGNDLTGTISSQIGLLSSLTSLQLARNQLTGSIPDDILEQCTNLVSLRLEKNQLSGSISTKLALLTELEHLELHMNQLTGSIPTEIGLIQNLKTLELWGNDLQGTLPTQLGLCRNLTGLYAANMNLKGKIPSELGLVTNLQDLLLAGNLFSGPLPSQLGLLTDLSRIILYGNKLTSTIPTQLGLLSNLKQLILWGNALSGSVPLEFESMYNLTSLSLYSNYPGITGTIPVDNLPVCNNTGKLEIDCSTSTCPTDCYRCSCRVHKRQPSN